MTGLNSDTQLNCEGRIKDTQIATPPPRNISSVQIAYHDNIQITQIYLPNEIFYPL